MGRTDDVWSLDTTARHSWSWGPIEMDARVDVFNVFDNQAVIEVEELAEYWDSGVRGNPNCGQTTDYQIPRLVRFAVGVSF